MRSLDFTAETGLHVSGLPCQIYAPFWVSLSFLLLCASLLCAPLCPPASHLLHQINNGWTQAALEISSNPPALFDFALRTRAVPYAGVILFLAGVFCYAMYWNEKNQDQLFSKEF